jgi:hypothetical protein
MAIAKRIGLLVVSLVLAGACGGSGGPSGFTVDSGGGGGGMDAGGVDGGGSHHDGGINLLGDSGGGDGSGADSCTGLACQVQNCASGGTAATTVSGTVYAPNGTLPLYDVQVFIPNAALAPFPKGVQCDQCGAPVSGSPITTGLSDPTGHFTLTGVPAGANIPIVVQLGKWRREATIPMVTACTTTTLTDPDLTRLPKNQMEGSMPHIALTAGGCDSLGCMLPKVGIDPAEFGYQSDGYNTAINTYNGDVTVLEDYGYTALPATAADNLWSSPSLLNTYDVAVFSCECSEALTSKGGSSSAPEFTNVTNYLNAGGRIFTTDFQYTWYKYSPTLDSVGAIAGGAPLGGDPITLATSFPKGAALAEWLKTVFPTDMYAAMGEVYPDYVFSNIQSLTAETLTWASSPDPTGPRVFTVDTPVSEPTTKQCGRGVHIDAHVDQVGTAGATVGCQGGTCYPATCTTPLKADEAMFAFFFFDLSSCIQNETAPPKPPPPAPK